jgi:hypothetical protein
LIPEQFDAYEMTGPETRVLDLDAFAGALNHVAG